MLHAIILAVLAFFVGGCATLPRPTAGLETSMEALCRKYAADCAWDGVSQAVTMHYRGQKVQALVGSGVVFIGDTKVMLSAPLKRRQGAVVVPPDFENIVFPVQPPLVEDKPFVSLWSGKVVVDAGHGGKDPGAIGFGGVKEKDIDYDIADRLVRSLRSAGIDAVLTRDSDVFITLAQRTEQASRVKADLFVSIHANASKSRRACGFEVYSAAPLNMEDQADVQRQQNVKRICAQLNMRQETPGLRNIVSDMLYDYKLLDTPVLAQSVSTALSRELGRDFRGSKAARFYVLRNTLVPAVLVEVGFISNPREAQLLKDGAYRQRIADAIAKGVMRLMNAAGN